MAGLFDQFGRPIEGLKPNPTGPGQPDLREIGLPGTLLLSGFIMEEQNPALQGRRGLDTFKAMGYDPTIAMLLKAIELPIRSVDVMVDPGDESPQSQQYADFIHANLFEFGSQQFDDVVRQAETGRNQFGFTVFEQVYRIADTGQYKGQLMWDKLAWRDQRTRYKWNVEEVDFPDGSRRRQLISMTQWAPPFWQYTVIPANKLLMFVRDMNGENYDGVSLLRACYKPWFIRDRLYSIQAVGLERAFMGIPVGRLHPGYNDTMAKLMKDIVKGIRTHERSGVVLDEEYMDLEILHNSLAGAEMQQAIDFLTQQIPLPALAQFTLLGSRNVGSFALSRDQSDMFLMGLNADVNYFCEVFNLDPGIPQLMRYNFGDVPDHLMPRLSHGEVGDRNLDKIMRGIASMLQWGGIIPDNGLEDYLRETLGAPPRDNSLQPEYLKSLLNTINSAPAVPQDTASRPPVPPGSAKAYADWIDSQMGSAPTQQQKMAEDARWELEEAYARVPWSTLYGTHRKGSRFDERERKAIKGIESFIELAEEVKSSASGKRIRPSERLGRMKRPYVLHGEENNPHIDKEAIARGARALQDIVLAQSTLKKKNLLPGSPVLEFPKQKMAERPSEVVDRAPEHIHDVTGAQDPRPVVAFDLNGTLTPTDKYPIDSPPFPGVKETLDRLAGQGVCIHLFTAGLYVGDKHDLDVQQSRIDMCKAWADEYGLPIEAYIPKVPAHVYLDDRMVQVNPQGPDFDQVAAQIATMLQRRFELKNGVWKRIDNPEIGQPIEDYPEPDEVARDHPRGFSGPRLDIDVHQTTTEATSSTLIALPVPGAKEAITELYNAGVTIHMSCAGWNPATKQDDQMVQNRLNALRQWLQQNGIPYDRLVTKDHAECYVDDKGMQFRNWQQDLPQLMNRLSVPEDEPLAMDE